MMSLSELTCFLILPLLVSSTCPDLSNLPRWSDGATWAKGSAPEDLEHVVISGRTVVLDTETSRLASLTLIEGGKLIFSPDDQVTLSSEYILIDNEGTMEIGTPECPYAGQAEILLTGERNDEKQIDGFGQKFLGVKEGGSLSIHGEDRLSWTRLENNLDQGQSSITVQDDVSSWRTGDKIVVTSTELDWEQAEVFTIATVSGNDIVLEEVANFDHAGRTIDGKIEMRAEVGLLSRNIKIHGEIDENCDDEEAMDDDVDADCLHFGGHTKALRGFKQYDISGAEFFHMGQRTVLGSYPIHFHLCVDTDADGTNPLISQNSLHNLFSRCVTIHGTHGVHVENNVAYDTFGHCFFLEDGGEKRTVFDRNLGIGSRKNDLTPSDKRPTVFWITSPETQLTNNVAAGSDQHKGIGIWYLFPDEVVQPSKEIHDLEGVFYDRREAKHTPILPFENNVAHSNGEVGVGMFNRLTEDHGITGCSTYRPTDNPKNHKQGNLVPVEFKGITAYKNGKQNGRFRATTIKVSNYRSAYSRQGILFERNMVDGFQVLEDAYIVGVEDMNEEYKHNEGQVGVKLHIEGPVHMKDVTVKNLKTGVKRKNKGVLPACGIKFAGNYRFVMGPSSTSENIETSEIGPEAADKVLCFKESTHKPPITETSIQIRDLDGSLTGTPMSSILFKNGDVIENECEYNEDWNLSVCKPELKFVNFYAWPKDHEAKTTFVTKGDTITGFSTKRLISYKTELNERYVLHMNQSMERNNRIKVLGLDQDESIILGICMPMATVGLDIGDLATMDEKWNDASEFVETDSLANLDTDPDANIFFDRTKGIVYVKFIEKDQRTPEDLADCAGSLKLDSCPSFLISLKKIPEADRFDADCTNRI